MVKDKQHLRIERKHPRVEAGIHCVVGLADGDLSTGQILDLSAGGLKFSCGRHTIHNILPEHRCTPGLVTGIVVEVHFELQAPELPATPIKCRAQLVHFERLAQDIFHVGVQFSRMSKAATRVLDLYLEHAPGKLTE